ncbi:THUMP-like domain-containing protein [Corynebacterium mayonis]|uniref:THUMP-like domain-containing protein n=1 Tax=Corynebacterium mayonis TaxID=3062461 RepID=UPI003140A752
MAFSVTEVDQLFARAEEIADMQHQFTLSKGRLFADRALAQEHFGDLARAVLELVGARRSAESKFPAHWLADSDSAQQATPAAVAEVRVERLHQAGIAFIHDVTCSIGTEARAAISRGMSWLGSDLDAARLRMARYNLGAGAWLARADALAPVTSLRTGTAVVADPARRVEGRRITDPAKLNPPLPALIEACNGRELAVKCAPGIDYSQWEGLVSVVSLRGGVKEACLYSPGLSAGLRREAVVLGAHQERITDAEPEDVEVAPPDSFIVEPDGAVIRAGLVRHWAHRHGLSMLDKHIAFLTGPAIPAGYSGFAFKEAVPLKKLRGALKQRGVGAIEILVRGVDLNPDVLRTQLRLKGPNQAAVVIARVGGGATAYVCGPREWG